MPYYTNDIPDLIKAAKLLLDFLDKYPLKASQQDHLLCLCIRAMEFMPEYKQDFSSLRCFKWNIILPALRDRQGMQLGTLDTWIYRYGSYLIKYGPRDRRIRWLKKIIKDLEGYNSVSP